MMADALGRSETTAQSSNSQAVYSKSVEKGCRQRVSKTLFDQLEETTRFRFGNYFRWTVECRIRSFKDTFVFYAFVVVPFVY